MTIVETRPGTGVTGGIDTHLDTHVAAALDAAGVVLGVERFAATTGGFRSLHVWLAGHGERHGGIDRVGMEGTGSYGAGLARHLRAAGVEVIEVDRPNRQARRRTGKTDSIDAVEAARAVQSGRACGLAKTADSNVEALRALMVARRSGSDTRTRCLNQLRHLGFNAPDDLREQFRGVTITVLVHTAAGLRPDITGDPVAYATKQAMRTLGTRVTCIDRDTIELDKDIVRLVAATAPALTELVGVGPHSAAVLLIAAGDNPERIHSEAAFAHLCGAAPIEASSGKTTRHRLNRAGNRQANHALWRIVFTRMGCDERTKIYVNRRLAEGRSKPEIIRSLKRYVAREVFPLLQRSA